MGVDSEFSSQEREKIIVKWLTEIQHDAKAIYLLGDIFDYWFEYRNVVPKGFTRLLGKIGELVDQSVEVHWLIGNHDMWTFGYLEQEIGVKLYKNPIRKTIRSKKLFIAHGDGLGNGDVSYKVLKRVFSNPFCQRLFSFIPSALGLPLMKYYSNKSRIRKQGSEKVENEKDQKLIKYCEKLMGKESVDYFIMGHRHRPKITDIANGTSKYINLGDWIQHFTYAVMNEKGQIELKRYSILS